MQIEITVTLTDDTNQVARSSVNRLAVATDLPGADPAVQKQDFLGQVENLVRTITENQVPALYADVEGHIAADDTAVPEATSEAQTAVRGKLKALKVKKQAPEADLMQDELPGTEPTATDSLKEQV